jgi:hypothetical protein
MTWQKYIGSFIDIIEKSKEDGIYTGEYITFDPLGYVEVRCMKCNEPIARREKKNGHHMLIPLPNHKQIFKDLSDETVAGFLFCDTCAPGINTCDEEEKERIMAVAQAGWVQEMINAHRDELVIVAYMEKKKDLKIV